MKTTMVICPVIGSKNVLPVDAKCQMMKMSNNTLKNLGNHVFSLRRRHHNIPIVSKYTFFAPSWTTLSVLASETGVELCVAVSGS